MNTAAAYCPRAFSEDMTDPINLAYCREVQRQNGDACRKKRCGYCVTVDETASATDKRPDKPDPPRQVGLF